MKRPSMDRSWTGWRKGRGEATSRTTTERKRRWRGRGIVEMAVPCRWNGCIARKVTEAMSCGMSCLAEEDWGVGIRRTCVEPWDGVVTGLHTAMRLGKFKNYGTLVTFLAVVHSVRHNPILDWCTWHPNPPPPVAPMPRKKWAGCCASSHLSLSVLPPHVRFLVGRQRAMRARTHGSLHLSWPLALSIGGFPGRVFPTRPPKLEVNLPSPSPSPHDFPPVSFG